MANACSFEITVTGPDESVKEMHAFFGPHLKPFVSGYYAKHTLRITDLWPDFDPKGWVEWIAIGDITHMPNRLRMDGRCNWAPPMAFLDRLSKQYPALTIAICFHVELMGDPGTYSVCNGSFSLIEYAHGYYLSGSR